MLQYILSFQTQQLILSLDIYMAGKLIQSIFIEQNTVINITGNHFTMFSVNHLFDKNVFMKDIYPPCYFQYLSRVNQINQITNDSYSVVFDNNYKVLKLNIHTELCL